MNVEPKYFLLTTRLNVLLDNRGFFSRVGGKSSDIWRQPIPYVNGNSKKIPGIFLWTFWYYNFYLLTMMPFTLWKCQFSNIYFQSANGTSKLIKKKVEYFFTWWKDTIKPYIENRYRETICIFRRAPNFTQGATLFFACWWGTQLLCHHFILWQSSIT